MATVLDVGLLGYFDVLFPFLFVFAIMFSILQKTKAITENAAINALIGVVAGAIVILSDSLVKMINFMLPWFVIVIIFFVLLLLVFRVMGATDDMFSNVLKNDKTVIWAVIGIGIIIFMAGVGSVIGQSLTEEGTGSSSGGTNVSIAGDGSTTSGSFDNNIKGILFNTKVLGMLLIFGVAIFAIAFLSGSAA